jgi:hypothetical protein
MRRSGITLDECGYVVFNDRALREARSLESIADEGWFEHCCGSG